MLQKPLPLYLFLAGILCSAIAGVAIGWKIGSESASASSVEPVVQPLYVPEPPVAPRLPMPEPDEEPKPDPEPEPSVGAETREFDFETMLAELEAMDLRIVPERFLAKLNVPVLAGEGLPALTDEVIELFALGEAEVGRINAAFAEAAAMLTAAEIEAAEIVEVSDTEVTIELPPAGDLAGQVEEELRQNVLATLGSTDGPLFLDLMKNSSGEYFNDFGRDGRTYTFSATPADDNRIALKVSTVRTNPRSGQVGHQASFSTTLNLNWEDPGARTRNYGGPRQRQDHVAALLPESIRQYFHAPDEAP